MRYTFNWLELKAETLKKIVIKNGLSHSNITNLASSLLKGFVSIITEIILSDA